MLSIVENIQHDDIQPYLDKYNLNTIDPQKWYSARNFIAILNEIGADNGGMMNLVAIGMAVAQKMLMPPELVNAPLSTILFLWNDLYHLQHRNGQIGEVKAEQINDHHIRTIHTHLYPDDFTYGLAYGMAKRFLPPGTVFRVTYDSSVPRIDEGGDVTIIDVEWN